MSNVCDTSTLSWFESNPKHVLLNVPYLIRKKIDKDALVKEINKKAFAQFAQQVKVTIKEFSVEIIDKTIESIDRRIKKILTTREEHRKY